MRGVYPLVSVQQGAGQSLYPLSKLVLRKCVQLTEAVVVFWFFFVFFKAARLWRQTEYKFTHGSISSLSTHICELDLLAHITTVMSIF